MKRATGPVARFTGEVKRLNEARFSAWPCGNDRAPITAKLTTKGQQHDLRTARHSCQDGAEADGAAHVYTCRPEEPEAASY